MSTDLCIAATILGYMVNLFTDFEDLAHLLTEKDHSSIKIAIEIVYLRGKQEGLASRVNGQVQKEILAVKYQLDSRIADFANQTLGFS